MGNTASKYQLPGADPETTNDCPTMALGLGVVTLTLDESGCVDDATGPGGIGFGFKGVVVAVGNTTGTCDGVR